MVQKDMVWYRYRCRCIAGTGRRSIGRSDRRGGRSDRRGGRESLRGAITSDCSRCREGGSETVTLPVDDVRQVRSDENITENAMYMGEDVNRGLDM